MGRGDHPETCLLKALCCQSPPALLKVGGGGGKWPRALYCHLLGLGVLSISQAQAQAQSQSRSRSQSLDNSPREVTYVFGRLRGNVRKPRIISQIRSPVFGDFGCKSWKTLRQVSGHVTRATWVLKVQCESPRVVPSDRLWNFSICSKDTGVIWPYLWRNYIWKKPCFTFSL